MKATYGLWVTKAEHDEITRLLHGCATKEPNTSTRVSIPGLEQPVHHPQYRNCDEARAAGITNIPMGDPDYTPALDRDNDGLACDDMGEPTS